MTQRCPHSSKRDILLHLTTKRTAMLQQLHEGLEVYILIEVMQKKPKECLNLFVIGDDDMVDAHYIISNLAPEMSECGSPKQKETEILDFFQDFLQELDDGKVSLSVAEDNGEKEDSGEKEDNGEPLSVPSVMQWLTGQPHTPACLRERKVQDSGHF